jgi:hypothetical protein
VALIDRHPHVEAGRNAHAETGNAFSRKNASPTKMQTLSAGDLRRVRLEGQSVARVECLRMLSVVVPRPQLNS